MSSFNFRLDSLVQIREWETQEAARDYGEAQSAVKDIELKMHEKRSDYESYSTKLRQLREQAGGVQGQMGVFDLMKKTLEELKGLENLLVKASQQEQLKLKEYLSIRGREQSLVKYKEREKTAFLKEVEKKEENLAEDGVIMRANREY